MQKIEIRAYAKINLFLEILDKLPNGYHKIYSIFQAIDLYDTLLISKTDKDFSLNATVNCSVKENLITKAREKMEDFTKRDLPCKIHLSKNIPESAGLGGGSSDAAATLIGLNNLFKLNLNLKQLSEIGNQIGKDVPFFIYNIGTALVEGTGEKIKVSNRKPSNFYVLAKPYQGINTSEIYPLFDQYNRSKSFLELVQKICPSVKKLYSYFSSISKDSGMTGTGPTIFAGFDSYKEAIKAKNNFKDKIFKGDFYICKPSEKTYEIVS
ncbi:MAG: 4-(cytidine 5'-diphospho)-2-C-methyl-D-erythritol kinase [Candidatus Paceibacterota bacterium]|jgi:4-diphosphocytidyl-2-C-methyl-D-erythritol kinase